MPFINDRLADQALSDAFDPSAHELAPSVAGSRLKHSRFLFEPEAVGAELHNRIRGQSAAIGEIIDELVRVKADIADPDAPLAVFLLAGPTGVGKTETVRVLAEAIHGRSDSFCRVDMNTLAQDHYTAAITGAPPGYVGSKEGHSVIDEEAVRGSFSRPGIVLFDELEKAGPEVLRGLLGALDSGRLRLTSGQKTLDFRNSLIFMTSNLGAREVAAQLQRWSRSWFGGRGSAASQRRVIDNIVHEALQKKLDPEFINRIDRLLVYAPLSADILPDVIASRLAQFNRRLASKGWSLSLSPTLIRKLQQETFDRQYGARSLRRGFRAWVEVPVARFLLSTDEQPTDETITEPRGLHCDWVDGRVHCRQLQNRAR
ncbi:AAA family ATPase [Marinimicrobium agarilyticum]|uniref:AAA family ATPase n=1 Tax=Marinimicrobium agarilyticum TaxID=306546 RepID=UPI0004252E50|nr:AAA family ATPase [Marinimicrobium agarilyticum]